MSRRNKLLHLYEWYLAVLLTCTVGVHHLQLTLHKIISQSCIGMALLGCTGEQQGDNGLWETLSNSESTLRAAASQARCGHSATGKFWRGDVVPFSQESPEVLAVSALVGKCTRPPGAHGSFPKPFRECTSEAATLSRLSSFQHGPESQHQPSPGLCVVLVALFADFMFAYFFVLFIPGNMIEHSISPHYSLNLEILFNMYL